ncbi:hypothetical protein BX070DRAFT_88352 [Coemansia spiralis]|nr:hypothetical protein BX070DRAFT_88352 [Coemansia spiralis]
MPKSSADTRDFLSEFTATYSYLFGSPPSATATPSQLDNGHHGVEDGSGMLSPVGSKHAQLDNRSQSESASENNYESAEDTNTADENEGSADDGNSVLNKEQEEERRKEEERKAAELRNRRRELIKQQVAFERMKERHRRQYPGQQQSSGLHSNVVRWQRESAKAVGTIAAPFHMQGQPKGQNVLHASNATINRGHAPGTVQHSNQQPYGNNMAGGSPLYSNIHANSSMPNMAAYAMQIHQQQFPQNAALLQPMQPVAAVGSGGEGYVSDAPHQAHALNTRYPTSMSQGSLPQNSQFPPEHVAPPLSHPVKLASAPKKTKNPYLSDSDNDDDDSSSSVTSNNMSGSDSLDMSSVGSSDISCEVAPSTLLKHPQSSSSISPERTGSRVMRSISQPVLSGRESGKSSKAAGNDSSSDASAKSQSSSKRRVRFHETVSVVFNSRRSITEEEYGSDNDSSNASVNMGIEQDWAYGADQNGFISHNSKTARAGSRMEEDDAFDVGDAFNHARYHISVAASAVKGHVGVQRDTRDMSATIENNKDINPVLNRNAYPDGSKGRTKRTKHRVETQPLRDREAEREQQWQQQQQKEMQQQREQQQREQHREQQMIKQAAADAADSEAFKNTQKAESDHTSTATIAKVDMDSSSTPSTGATEPVKPVIDHMAEARRALLGHYNVPNPSLPVGTSIPRSGNARTTYVHTSSVKVLKPQSFARPKNQYSKGPSSAFASKSAEQKDDMAKSKLPGLGSQKETLAANPNSRTNQALESAISNPSDSQEFQISNVLQNFSISSFEVTKNKEGGMYIRYSDQSKKSHSNAQVSTKVSYANDTEGINGKNDSDGDEIPLAAIARSRSEPAKRVLPHTSADNHLVCLSASASTGAQDYNSNELRQSIVTSNGSRGESPKSPKHFFSRISTDSARRALTRNSSLSNSKTAASCVQKREEVVRSVSVDSGTRSPLQLQPKSHIKRRFSRWGTFFS